MDKTPAHIFFKCFTALMLTISLLLPVTSHAKENILRMLIWEGYAPEKSIETFKKYIEKKYKKKLKIQVSFVKNSDSFYNPVRGKNVDIISPTYHMFNDQRWALIDKGLILPLNMENIPNFKNISPALQNAEYFNRKGIQYAAPLAQGPYGLVYNSNIVKKAPESWNALWQPEYRNKYVLAKNEYMHNCMLTALASGYPREDIYKFDILDNITFKNKLDELAKNAHSFWSGTDKVEDLIGKSLATSWGFALKGLKQKGEVWKLASPKEGTVYWVDNYSITWALEGKPMLRKIAEEWINYTLSPDFQIEIIMRDLSCYPVTTDIKERATKEEKEIFNLDEPEKFQRNRIGEPNLSLRDRHGLELLWKKALEKRATP